MNLLVAPPASGKTTLLVEKARAFTREGKRVWWVGLPSQRSYVYKRLTEAGALLGVEFLSSQQVYYRLLAHALKLKPLVVGTGRLALVGEALLELRKELPSPGEARLFATAIAEAKRYGLNHSKIHSSDEEVQRFAEVFRLYERVKGERWDYDNFRTETLKHAHSMTPEADVIIVDGFRDIGPLELRIYKALATHSEVWLSLPEAPPGETATLRLEPRQTSSQTVYRAANPVTEARWVLRSLKKDLAESKHVLDLAVIMPERGVKAFLALADEYGVPLMDETPKALADSLAGRLLLDLLELPDYPTASRLLAIPDLNHLANAALNRGVAGLEAINILADTLGLAENWRRWLGLLEVPDGELEWAERLLDTSLPEIRKDLLTDETLKWEQFKKHALQRAKEASTLAKGANFRKWWAALLQESKVFDSPRGGVALLTDKLASGRRFQKAYLMHAIEGAYTVGEGEDYFIPEEERKALIDSFAKLGLPKRFLGRDAALYQELLTRAAEVIVTYPEADQGGPLVAEPELINSAPKELPRLPDLPAASRLELPSEYPYRSTVQLLKLKTTSLEKLKRYDDCAFRFWAEECVPDEGEKPWWLELLGEMRNYKRLNPARLEVLKNTYPEAAIWLTDYATRLMDLNFGVSVPENEAGPSAFIDAAGRSGNELLFYRFTAPGRVSNQAEAGKYIDNRWNEHWAAGAMLGRFQGRVSAVHIFVWPIKGEPIAAYDGGIAYIWRRISNKQEKILSAYARFQTGDVSPNPGFHCRDCLVSDICRVGQR